MAQTSIWRHGCTPWGIAAFILAMLVAPAFAEPGYSQRIHSISELGAQGARHGWIMNAGFVAFGAAVVADARLWWRRVPSAALALMLFGGAQVLCAFFSHRPLDQSLAFDAGEDLWHSVFATAMGFALVAAALVIGFAESEPMRRRACFGMAAVATLVPPLLIFSLVDWAGLSQRAMFLMSFAWFLLFARPRV